MVEVPFEPHRLIVVYMGFVRPVTQRPLVASCGGEYAKLCHKVILITTSVNLARTGSLVPQVQCVAQLETCDSF
jgi:hypothetical protein